MGTGGEHQGRTPCSLEGTSNLDTLLRQVGLVVTGGGGTERAPQPRGHFPISRRSALLEVPGTVCPELHGGGGAKELLTRGHALGASSLAVL